MFYVYVYLDPRKSGKFSYKTVSFLYEPIYIGKGKDRRYLIHLKLLKNKQKSHFKNKLLKILLESSRGKPGSMLGREHSEEAKRKMSQARIGKRVGAKNPMFGRKHSDETKRKMSQAKLEKKLRSGNAL